MLLWVFGRLQFLEWLQTLAEAAAVDQFEKLVAQALAFAHGLAPVALAAAIINERFILVLFPARPCQTACGQGRAFIMNRD